MAENQQMVVYAAAYESENAALDDLAAIEQLHNDKLIGAVDAAVIDLWNGKPHVVRRLDRARIRFIPEMFGAGRCRARSLSRRLSSSPLTRQGSSRSSSRRSKKGSTRRSPRPPRS